MPMSAEYRAKRGKETNLNTQEYDFGVADGKGRKLGTMVTTFEIDYTLMTDAEAEASYSGYPSTLVGHHFGYETASLRDGKGFGAWAGQRLFRTAAERDRAAAKYVEGARKRAHKNAGK